MRRKDKTSASVSRTHLPAGVAELDAALADVDGDNFTRPARVAFVARSFFCSIKRKGMRLVHEWAHSSYMDGMVKEEKEDGTFAVVLMT